MWDSREKNSFFQGQSMHFYSTGSELTSRENTRLVPPNDGPDRQFLNDTLRKRKAVDSDFASNVCDDISTRYWAKPSSDSGHLLPRESSAQHNVHTVNFQQKTAKIFSDHYSHTEKPTNQLSQARDYRFYNMSSSLMSSQRRDGDFQEYVVDDLHNEVPYSPIKTPVGGIPNLPDSQNFEQDIARHSDASNFQSFYNQSSNCVEKAQAALGSNDVMNSGLRNNNVPIIPHPPYILSSRDLTFLGSSQLRMVHGDYNQDGGIYAQDFSKNGLVDVKKSGQNMVLADDNLSICTTNSGQTSIDDRKETYGSYQYSDTEMRSSNYPCKDSLGARLIVRDGDMLQSAVLAETFGREEACLENGMSKYTTLVSTDLGTKPVEKNDGSDDGNKCHSLGGASPKSDNILTIRPVEFGDGMPSLALDKQSKSAAARISPVIVEKLWDGSLQLNTSTTISAVAFFKSGDKAQDINWSEHIEIKGKVRLQAFEKFIQELPRSRNRALMVISLCWNVGSSKYGLAAMKEIARGYKETERVGFAQICPGFDLYLCPRSDTIITILAKHGFFKGMAAVEEDQDSFIGCIVWRRIPPPSNADPQKTEIKKETLSKQPVNSPESSIAETNFPLSKVFDIDGKQPMRCTSEPDGIPNEFMSDTRSIDLDKSSGNPTNSAPEIAPTFTSPTPVQLCIAQQPGSTSLQETMEHGEIQAMKIAEPRDPGLSSEPTLLPGPPPKFPGTQRSSRETTKDLHSLVEFQTDPSPESISSIPSNSLLRQAEPSATQWSGSNSQEEPTKLWVPIIHTAELNKPDTGFDITRPVFPGSPMLLPEILLRILGSSRDVHQDTAKGMSKSEPAIMHTTEASKTGMGSIPTGHILPRAPESLPPTQQKPAGPSEDDDLPEFDFSSACGVLEAPVGKFPWPGHEYHFPEAPQFNKQLPNEVVKNAEVMQISQAPSCPEKPFSTYQAINLPAKFEEINAKKKFEYQASQSFSRPLTMNVENSSASPRSSNSLPRKNRWDDDDDMPEWCPPDLEHLDHPQPNMTPGRPSPILRPTADNEVLRPPFPAQSLTPFHQSHNQGILDPCQTGLQGPHGVQTRPVAGFAQSPMNHLVAPSHNQLSRHPTGKFDVKPPGDVNWRWPRP